MANIFKKKLFTLLYVEKFKIIEKALNVLFIIFATVISVQADSLDKVQIIKILPKEKQAIVKMDDGRMRMIRVGDEIIIKSDDEFIKSILEDKKSENKDHGKSPMNDGSGNKVEDQRMLDQRKRDSAIISRMVEEQRAKVEALNNPHLQEQMAKMGFKNNQIKKDKVLSRKAKVMEISTNRIMLEDKTKQEAIIMKLEEKVKSQIPADKLKNANIRTEYKKEKSTISARQGKENNELTSKKANDEKVEQRTVIERISKQPKKKDSLNSGQNPKSVNKKATTKVSDK